MILSLNQSTATYRPGDAVVFRMQKRSTHPGPRAADVRPDRFGDQYSYMVDKFWVIDRVLDDGRLVARTRRGKTHTLHPADPRLHRARWWDKLRYGSRFPQAEPTPAG